MRRPIFFLITAAKNSLHTLLEGYGYKLKEDLHASFSSYLAQTAMS